MKKISRRDFLKVMAIGAAAAGLAGCGAASSGTAASSAAASGAASSTAAAAGEKVQLTAAIWGDEKRQQRFLDLMKPFCDENNCEVTINLVNYADYAAKLATDLASGNAPDVVWLSDGMEAQFIAGDWLYDIGKTLQSDADYGFDDFYTDATSSITYGDALYGIPFSFGPRILLYNKTLMEKAGVKTPLDYYNEGNWTYDTMFKMAADISKSGSGLYGLKLSPNGSEKNYIISAYDLILAYGADFFNSDTSKFTLNDANGIAAVQAWYDSIYKDGGSIKPGDDTAFTSGTIGLARENISTMKTVVNGSVDFEWDIIGEPTGPADKSKLITGYAYWAVTDTSKNVDLAANLVKYMSSKDVQLNLADTFVSPRASVVNSDTVLQRGDGYPDAESIKRAFVQPIEERGLRPYPAHVNFAQIQDKILQDFELIWAGNDTVADGIAQMETDVTPLLTK